MPRRINKFFVEQAYLELAAEAIRVHTVRSGRFQTYNSTAERGCRMVLQNQPTAQELEQADSLSGPGDIPITFTITHSWACEIDRVTALCSKIAGKPVPYRTVTALLMLRVCQPTAIG